MRVAGDGNRKKVAPRGPNTHKQRDARDDGAVGSALRAAYQSAIDEKIPDDLLDLLGKLS